MRVLVAGATGVIGRPLLAALRAGGHQVSAMVRDASQASGLDADDTVVADGLDQASVRSAVLAAQPDVVVHQMTALRGMASGVGEAMELTGRLRTEGTANLIVAARAAGVRRLVAQSIAFAAAPRGGPVLDEDAPLYLDAPDPGWSGTVRTIAELERVVLGSSDIAGVVLRYGALYGPHTAYARDGRVGQAVANGRLPLAGAGSGITSFLHVRDAVGATVAAIESNATGVFHVTDDEPAPAAQWLTEYAGRLGGPPPRTVPIAAATRLLGWFATHQLTEQRGAANERARAVLGWKPERPRWRDVLGDE